MGAVMEATTGSLSGKLRLAFSLLAGLGWLLAACGVCLSRATVPEGVVIDDTVTPDDVFANQLHAPGFLVALAMPVALALLLRARGGREGMWAAVVSALVLVCAGAMMQRDGPVINRDGWRDACDALADAEGDEAVDMYRYYCVAPPLSFTGAFFVALFFIPVLALSPMKTDLERFSTPHKRALASVPVLAIGWLVFTIGFGEFNRIAELDEDATLLYMLSSFTPIALIFVLLWLSRFKPDFDRFFDPIVVFFLGLVLVCTGGAMFGMGFLLDLVGNGCDADGSGCDDPQAMVAGSMMVMLSATLLLATLLVGNGKDLSFASRETTVKGAFGLLVLGWLLGAAAVAVFRAKYPFPDEDVFGPSSGPYSESELNKTMIPAFMFVVFGIPAVIGFALTRLRGIGGSVLAISCFMVTVLALVGAADIMNSSALIMNQSTWEFGCHQAGLVIEKLDSGDDSGTTVPFPVRFGGRRQDCAPGCLDGWPGDGICDPACNVPECSFDLGDCGSGDPDGGACPNCPTNWIGDGVCDTECNCPELGNDGGDCGDGPSGEFSGSVAVLGSIGSGINDFAVLLNILMDPSFDPPPSMRGAFRDLVDDTRISMCYAPQVGFTGAFLFTAGVIIGFLALELGDGVQSKNLILRIAFVVPMLVGWFCFMVSFAVYSENSLTTTGSSTAVYFVVIFFTLASLFALSWILIPFKTEWRPNAVKLATAMLYASLIACLAVFSDTGRAIDNNRDFCDTSGLSSDAEEAVCTTPAAIFAAALIIALSIIIVLVVAQTGQPAPKANKHVEMEGGPTPAETPAQPQADVDVENAPPAPSQPPVAPGTSTGDDSC